MSYFRRVPYKMFGQSEDEAVLAYLPGSLLSCLVSDVSCIKCLDKVNWMKLYLLGRLVAGAALVAAGPPLTHLC